MPKFSGTMQRRQIGLNITIAKNMRKTTLQANYSRSMQKKRG